VVTLPDTPAGPEWLSGGHTKAQGFVLDCYALNVSGETAYMCACGSFHLVSVTGDEARDHGAVPVRGAHGIVVADDRPVLVGEYGRRTSSLPRCASRLTEWKRPASLWADAAGG
jgi:hypothetical protein